MRSALEIEENLKAARVVEQKHAADYHELKLRLGVPRGSWYQHALQEAQRLYLNLRPAHPVGVDLESGDGPRPARLR